MKKIKALRLNPGIRLELRRQPFKNNKLAFYVQF